MPKIVKKGLDLLDFLEIQFVAKYQKNEGNETKRFCERRGLLRCRKHYLWAHH